MIKAGAEALAVTNDLAGRERVVSGRKKGLGQSPPTR
jgi:hypothetical protein